MSLIEKTRALLQKRSALAQDRTGAPTDLEIQAATAVLLIEAAYGDERYVWREHRTIVKGLEREFGLGRKETLDLLERANDIRPPAVTLADVTDVIRDRFSREQQREVVKLVWRVIEADAAVEEWEEAFADHVAKAVGLTPEEAGSLRSPSAGR